MTFRPRKLMPALLCALAAVATGCDDEEEGVEFEVGGSTAGGAGGGKQTGKGGAWAGGNSGIAGASSAGAPNNVAGAAGSTNVGGSAQAAAGTSALTSAGTGNTPASGGSSPSGGTSASGGQPATGGTSLTGGTTSTAAAGAGVAGAPVDRDVYRPQRLPFNTARLSSLTVPAGFEVGVFARDLGAPRMLAVHGPHVYVTRPENDDVVMLTDSNQDGAAENSTSAITGLDNVHGIAFRDNTVYLATVTAVYAAAVNSDGTFATPDAILEDLPQGGQHPYRTLGIGPDNRLYISVGSSCDACAETDEDYATILRVELDGSARTVFARGLRNTLGFGWHPTTGELWGVDQGSDWRGDDLPPEEVNQIVQGGNYGWPYCFSQRVIDPVIEDPPQGTKTSVCANTEAPALELQAHGSPLQMAFYTGSAFPEEFRNDAFLALHGSWNRYPPTGYKVVRVRFDAEGTPMAFDDFLTGFLVPDGSAQFGRPTGVVVAPDGALLIGDDENGIVYRVWSNQ